MKKELDASPLIGELFHAILRKWWLVVLLAVLAAGTGDMVTHKMIEPVYQSQSVLFIGKDKFGVMSLNVADLRIGSALISDYRELIKSRLITEQVIDELALLASRKDLVERLEISIIDDSRFMYIRYKDPSPEKTKIIVNRLSEVLVARSVDILSIENIQIVDYALTPVAPISPNRMKVLLVSAFLGGLLGVGVVFLQVVSETTVKSEAQLEALIDSPVLGSIPRFAGVQRKG